MKAIIFILLVFWSSSSLVFAETLVNLPSIKLKIALPIGWVELNSDQFYENLGKVKLEDPEFESKLRKSANLPALVATKFPEPYEKLNPSIKINVRPYGNVKTRDPVKLATLLTAGISKAFADFQVISLPTAVSVGGKPSGFVSIRYTLKTADASFPTESSLWVVPTEHYFLMIGVGYSADEAKEIKPEIATSMKSIEFTD